MRGIRNYLKNFASISIISVIKILYCSPADLPVQHLTSALIESQIDSCACNILWLLDHKIQLCGEQNAKMRGPKRGACVQTCCGIDSCSSCSPTSIGLPHGICVQQHPSRSVTGELQRSWRRFARSWCRRCHCRTVVKSTVVFCSSHFAVLVTRVWQLRVVS